MEPKKQIEQMSSSELLAELHQYFTDTHRMMTHLEMDNAKTRALVVKFHKELQALREEMKSA